MNNGTARLLLVEPEPMLAEITAFRLELLGYEVMLVDTGRSALVEIENNRPDMVIVDMVLPDVEAIDLLAQLANDSATAEIPVMVFSTESDLETVQRAYRAGVVDYLVVPFDPANLEAKVSKVLAGSVPATT